MKQKSVLQFVAIALIAAGLLILTALLPTSASRSGLSAFSPSVVVAQQSSRTAQLWQRVYEVMPDLPLENQYVSTVTGEVATDNTLAGRLIQYHLYVKSRPSSYRLDWKLTMADYLGANQPISPTTYPGADTLRPNPRTGDIAAIGQLNRAQRDQLVSALVSVFSASDSPVTPTAPASGSNPSSQPTQPGAAELLLP